MYRIISTDKFWMLESCNKEALSKGFLRVKLMKERSYTLNPFLLLASSLELSTLKC